MCFASRNLSYFAKPKKNSKRKHFWLLAKILLNLLVTDKLSFISSVHYYISSPTIIRTMYTAGFSCSHNSSW